jgi:hypothetical protein
MSSIYLPSWTEQQSLFKLSCDEAEICNQFSSMVWNACYRNVVENISNSMMVQDTPVPSLQRADSELGIKKMAIPRLAEGAESAFTSPGRFHRRHVRRACESCRQRKTKCTGDKSGCRNCREAGIICCYTDGKREKSKRSVDTCSVLNRYS